MMGDKCKVIINRKVLDATFMGIFQHSFVVSPSPMRGGHAGGVESYPVAVVKIEGQLKEVRVSDVRFEEHKKETLHADGKEYTVDLSNKKYEGFISSMEEFEVFHKSGDDSK